MEFIFEMDTNTLENASAAFDAIRNYGSAAASCYTKIVGVDVFHSLEQLVRENKMLIKKTSVAMSIRNDSERNFQLENLEDIYGDIARAIRMLLEAA